VLKPKFEIAIEHYSEQICAELLPLLKKNWAASASYKADIKLDPDFAKYKKMDELGMMHPVIARVDGRIVGYAIWFTVSSFNYAGITVAHGSAWYMEEGYRGYGLTLLHYGERLLREKGIRRFYWFVSPGSDLQRLLATQGYESDELIMEKIT
jgi:L-amino acid N-acyltransferase YncA